MTDNYYRELGARVRRFPKWGLLIEIEPYAWLGDEALGLRLQMMKQDLKNPKFRGVHIVGIVDRAEKTMSRYVVMHADHQGLDVRDLLQQFLSADKDIKTVPKV